MFPPPLPPGHWFTWALGLSLALVLGLAVIAIIGWRKAGRLAQFLQVEIEQKSSELVSSERQFRILFQESLDAICLFRKDGMLQRCNPAAEEFFGISAARPCSISELFADYHEEARFRQELAEFDFLRDARFQMKNAQGQLAEVQLSVNPQRDRLGLLQCYQVIAHDITQLIRLEQQLRNKQKMEAIGLMAGGIAHDFNNFLAVIMYGLDLIRLKAPSNLEVMSGVEMIEEAVERGRKLTAQIQSFSRAPGLEKPVIDARATLLELPRLLGGLIPEHVEFQLDVATDLGAIRADQEELTQVLVNLIQNACHAMPHGGRLTMTAANDEQQLSAARTVREVVITIADTGSGIPADIVDKVFDPFFTTRPQGQGTGLGLAIAYGVVQQCGGKIQVTSTPAHGTRFEVRFPRSVQASPAPETAVAGAEELCGTEKVLLVDDEPVLRGLMRESLERHGFRVLTAADGSQAQRILESVGDVDLLVTDVVMPGKSGFSLAEWVRDHCPEVRLLLVSGFPSMEGPDPHDMKGWGFLRKPFRPLELVARVRDTLDQPTSAT